MFFRYIHIFYILVVCGLLAVKKTMTQTTNTFPITKIKIYKE